MLQPSKVSFRMCSSSRTADGPEMRPWLAPSIRLHLVKPCLDLALAHLPDGRDDGELRGPWARRAGLPVVDGLGGDAHERAHLRCGQAEPRPLRAHALRLEP